jgi:hypothetical protein
MRARLGWSVVVAAGMAIGGCGTSAASTPAGPMVLDRIDGADLTRLSLPGGNAAYLQRIDVLRMRIDQVTGERDGGSPAADGDYYPGAPSPRFRRITAEEMQVSCHERYGGKAFSAVNFAFFEEYDTSTRLSFPVKAGGVVLSGGSSPYGPVPAPKNERYRHVELKALRWDEHGVSIGRYRPGTGEPLNQPGTRDALVTYAYGDHPAALLGDDPANRYQLLGVADPTHLLILTVVRATLAAAAALLRKAGARGDILTFDGGISTYLWSGTRGDLVTITNRDGSLPHYLCVHAAGNG